VKRRRVLVIAAVERRSLIIDPSQLFRSLFLLSLSLSLSHTTHFRISVC
jgi:hypothetical protein